MDPAAAQRARGRPRTLRVSGQHRPQDEASRPAHCHWSVVMLKMAVLIYYSACTWSF